MANRKASAFSSLSSLSDTSNFAMAITGTNYKLAALKIWEYVKSKIKGSAVSISTGGTIALEANDYVIALVVSNAGGAPVTFSVGTSAGGTQIIDGEVVAASSTSEPYVINYFQASAANIHFTLNTGSLSVRVIKQ